MPLTPPTLSALTAGILILLQMLLMLTVVLARRRNRQSLGDGGNPQLSAAIARHGNFAENAAIFIVGFTLLEVFGGNRTMLAALCATFVAGRLSHIIGVSVKATRMPFRIVGVAITAGVGLSLGVKLVGIALANLHWHM